VKTLNIGILAHVDAGKTSLTERLLYATGVIDRVGSVDRGTTQTDTLELERRRGITIQSAVVSFLLGDLTVNLIDTPGHSDFIAEVDRAVRVLDGAILVVSAVEGVQPQTRVIMRTLAALKIPTLIFANKIDRGGAAYHELLSSIRQKLTPGAIVMNTVADIGTKTAGTTRLPGQRWVETLAEHNESFLQSYVDGTSVDERECVRELASQTAKCLVHPVLFGSAVTGEGVGQLINAIHDLLPVSQGGDALSGRVFKIERGPGGEKLAYVRLFSGSVEPRQLVTIHRQDLMQEQAKVTSLQVFRSGGAITTDRAIAGQIAKLGGLSGIRIGDQLGSPDETASGAYFSPPTLETVVGTPDPADRPRLFAALQALVERDPLIGARRDPDTGTLSVRLYGEVQKEVIAAQLETEFDVRVFFADTQTIHIERPASSGQAVHRIAKHGPNFFFATIGLRIEPAAVGSGVAYHIEVELGSLPAAFHHAIEETVRHELHRGLYGWEVTDCLVTLTHSGFASPISTAGDFRGLGKEVIRAALEDARTRVYEPFHRFDLEVPAETMTAVLAKLADSGALLRETVVRDGIAHLDGLLPARCLHGFEKLLPGLAQGEGVFRSTFAEFRPVTGAVPRRQAGSAFA
jgi:ribosomal protection tetracycline resistance protein